MKKSILISTILLSASLLAACGESEANPLTYVFVNNDTDGEHYEVYYNGTTSLPEVTKIASTYNDNKNGEHPVKGFYYDETNNKGAFEGCATLRSIEVPDSITSISKKAFKKCNKLTRFDVGYDSEMISVGEEAFQQCNDLISFRVGPKLKTIGKSAFGQCEAMTTLLDYNCCILESIDDNAFLNDYSLYSLPNFNELKSIGDNAFSRCHAIDYVSLPSIQSLGDGAFSKCNNLHTFQFGNTCTIDTIPSECFLECRSLTEIGIPYRVHTIEDYAFSYCSSLNYIAGPLYISTIGDGAFQGCSSLPSAPITDSCLSIGDDAFKECTSLGEVIIPSSVTSIGSGVFNSCRNLRTLTVDSANTNFDSRNNCNAICTKVEVVGEKGNIPANTLIAASANTTIPSSVTSLGSGVYTQFDGIKEITIPNNITSVNTCFISSCNDLESITFESGSSITTFVVKTLFNLPNLKSLVLPDSLQQIDTYGFDNVRTIDEITLPITVNKIASEAFYYMYDLGVINYPGTIAQFNAIEKADDWIKGALSTCVVRCSDGEIPVGN